MTNNKHKSVSNASRPNVVALKLTSTAAIRAACELSLAQGARCAEVMYKSDDFEDDDYVGADLDEFTDAKGDQELLNEFCGGRHSWELWVYEWPQSAGMTA
jgi:hypothetical protein